MPDPPGTVAMSHLPLVSGALLRMYAVIHAGQVMVANWPCWHPVFHSGLNSARAADCFAWIDFTARSQACLTTGLVPAMTSPLSS